MRSLTLYMDVLLGIVLATHAAAQEAERVVLENQVLRLEIGKSRAPHVARLVHRASGQALVDNPQSKNLFAIVLVNEDGGQETVESASAGESSVEVVSGQAVNKVVLRYAKFPVEGLAAEVTATCDVQDRLVRWSMRLENPSGRQIAAIRFPMLMAVPTIGQGQDDVLVLPALPGTLIENPAENWRNGQSVTLNYPGNMSAQFVSFQDRAAGLYLAGTDTQGYPMALCVLKQPEGFWVRHEFTPVPDARNASEGVGYRGKTWESPYAVALGVSQGTWCDAADQYKQWAVCQPWCVKTLAERDDVPSWWKAGPDVHVLEMRTYDNQRVCTGSYYPKLLDHLRVWRAKIEGPVVAMLAGWENHRRWTAGDYFPVFDEENAKKVIAQLKQEGFRPFFFLSGLFYTYENEGRDAATIRTAEKYAPCYVVDAQTGQPKQFHLNESSPAGDWKRHSYEFCVGVPQTEEFFRRVLDQALALGVDVLQMDQTVQGAGQACYSTSHGHAPGAGLYQSQDFWRLLDHLRHYGKSKSPDFVLLHEEPHEQLIPYLDGFHVREYYEKRWYRASPGAVGIPLFSYLYHEYAIGYGGDSASLSKHDSRWLVRAHAMNLVAGRTPGGSIWSSHPSAADAHPDQITVLRNHCRLLATRAKEFLMLGKMLHPCELDVPTLKLKVPVDRRGRWEEEEFSTPAILTSSWQSPAGNVGHLFVNISAARQALKLNLDTRNAPAFQPYDVAVYRSTDDQGFRPLWQGLTTAKEFSAELAPLEVIFVELQRAKAR